MSIRIRNNGREYVSYFNVQQDRTFNTETEQTMPVEMREYVVKSIKGYYTVPMIFVGWLSLMMTAGTIGSIYNLLITIFEPAESDFDRIFQIFTYGFMLAITGLLLGVFVRLLIKLYNLNNPTYENTEFFWRRGYVSSSQNNYYGNRQHRYINVDSELIPPLTGLDYEAAGPGKEFIVIYLLNKNKTSISRTFAFSPDFSNHETIIAGIMSQEISENAESGRFIDANKHDYIASNMKRKCFLTVIGTIINMIPILTALSVMTTFLPMSFGSHSGFMSLLQDEAFMQSNGDIVIFLGITVAIICLILLSCVMHMLRIIIATIKVNTHNYTFETGQITNLQSKIDNRRRKRYIWVNNIRCKPLHHNDFMSSELGDSALIINIKVPINRLTRYAMKDN